MIPIPDGTLDLLAIGEVLVDFISLGKTDSLAGAQDFRRYQGGSPANIAVNVAKLGGKAGIVARAGDDAFGHFLKAVLTDAGVDTTELRLDPDAHTSIVFVARTAGTPDFQPMRGADYQLAPDDITTEVIQRARVVHTSTWPLSREPARSAIGVALKAARDAGRIVSLDPNYSPRVWPDRDEALTVLSEMFALATVTKPSLDDVSRIFGAGQLPEDYIARVHALGPQVVVLTMGHQGTLLSDGQTITHVPARPIKVADATGAGDAFWAGFLMALLDGYSLKHCAYAAREIAEQKLTRVGPLPDRMDRHAIHNRVAKLVEQDAA
jgi:fructokinase